MPRQQPRHACERCPRQIQFGRYCMRCFDLVWNEEQAAGVAEAHALGCRFTDLDKANGDPVQDAAIRLKELMSGLSERCWSAGWLIGCEHSLWAFSQHGPGSWGQNEVTEADVERLRDLSAACDGWWYWPDDSCDLPISAVSPVFIALAEWKKKVARG
jgi:hypothetical protein